MLPIKLKVNVNFLKKCKIFVGMTKFYNLYYFILQVDADLNAKMDCQEMAYERHKGDISRRINSF